MGALSFTADLHVIELEQSHAFFSKKYLLKTVYHIHKPSRMFRKDFICQLARSEFKSFYSVYLSSVLNLKEIASGKVDYNFL